MSLTPKAYNLIECRDRALGIISILFIKNVIVEDVCSLFLAFIDFDHQVQDLVPELLVVLRLILIRNVGVLVLAHNYIDLKSRLLIDDNTLSLIVSITNSFALSKASSNSTMCSLIFS